MASCMAWCLTGRSRAPPANKGYMEGCDVGGLEEGWRIGTAVKRASIAFGESMLMRAAASSIARGRPSRWAQIAAIVSALSSVRVNWDLTDLARATKRATAG